MGKPFCSHQLPLDVLPRGDEDGDDVHVQALAGLSQPGLQ